MLAMHSLIPDGEGLGGGRGWGRLTDRDGHTDIHLKRERGGVGVGGGTTKRDRIRLTGEIILAALDLFKIWRH